jgi:hypothetical protein
MYSYNIHQQLVSTMYYILQIKEDDLKITFYYKTFFLHKLRKRLTFNTLQHIQINTIKLLLGAWLNIFMKIVVLLF